MSSDGFDIVINGVNKLFADLDLSAIASTGFHKEHFPEDTVQIALALMKRCALCWNMHGWNELVDDHA